MGGRGGVLASCACQEQNIAASSPPPIFDTNKLPIGGLLSRPIFNAVASSPSAAFFRCSACFGASIGRLFLWWKPSSSHTYRATIKLRWAAISLTGTATQLPRRCGRPGRNKASRFSSHSRGCPSVLPSTGATPPDPRRCLTVAQRFFFYHWSQGAGPSDLSRNTDGCASWIFS